MNLASIPVPAARTDLGAARTARIYLLEAKHELLKLLRLPAFSLPTLGFPLLFYVLFGLAMFGGKPVQGLGMSTYLIATYGAFGVIGAALFGFGVGVAMERGQGWMLQKRATPMPLGAYFTAKLAMAALFGAIIVGELSLCGALFGGVRLEPGRWLSMAGILVAGSVPFAALGLAFGYLCGPNSAPAVVNLVYLPTAFASGLWVPIDFLPGAVQKAAQFLPGYHLAQLALDTIGAGRGESALVHVAALAGFAALGLLVAWIGYRRDEDRMYG
jgi:ABC-2 type transport system permease protein